MAAFAGLYNKIANATNEAWLHGVSAKKTDQSAVVNSKQGVGFCLYPTAGTLGDSYTDDQYIVLIEGHPYLNHEGRTLSITDRNFARAIKDEYIKLGIDLLAQIRGSFSLCIISIAENSILLAVDRMGVRPLYYAIDDKLGVLYGSRLSDIAEYPGLNISVNRQAIYSYLYFHMIPSPQTVFAGVQKLELGEFVLVKHGKIQQKKYWQPEFSELCENVSDLKQQTFDALRNAVKRAGRSDSGSFLSGGLDSSTVTGLLRQEAGPDVLSFSVGFDAEGYDEMAFARVAAKHFNVAHKEYYVTPADVVNAVPFIAQAYDEPFGNSSAVPTYFCAKVAAEHGIHRMLAGDGGDELFAGNERYAKQKVFEAYAYIPNWLRKQLLEPLLRNTPFSSRVMPLRKMQSYIDQANIPLPDRLQTYNYFHRHRPDEILCREFVDNIDLGFPLASLRHTYNEVDAENPLNRMLWLDWKKTLADNDLRKVNVMCELAGVDVRYPMLDEEVVDISTRIPSSLKLPGFKLRDFYKKTFESFLPKEVLSKSKHGFGLPFGVWMKDYQPLKELAYDAIGDFKSRKIVNEDYLEGLLHRHQHEHASYYGEQIWVFMMLEHWLQSHSYSL